MFDCHIIYTVCIYIYILITLTWQYAWLHSMTCWCEYMSSSMYQSYIYIYIYIYIKLYTYIYTSSVRKRTVTLTVFSIYFPTAINPSVSAAQGATYVSALESGTIAPHTLALKAYVRCRRTAQNHFSRCLNVKMSMYIHKDHYTRIHVHIYIYVYVYVCVYIYIYKSYINMYIYR